MNGSNRAAGKAAVQDPGLAPYCSGHEGKQCFLCEKVRERTATCEDWERVGGAAWEVSPQKRARGKPPTLTVCKDCCIGVEGHGCPWWRFCWGEWP